MHLDKVITAIYVYIFQIFRNSKIVPLMIMLSILEEYIDSIFSIVLLITTKQNGRIYIFLEKFTVGECEAYCSI